jgi:hypothetical protein
LIRFIRLFTSAAQLGTDQLQNTVKNMSENGLNRGGQKQLEGIGSIRLEKFGNCSLGVSADSGHYSDGRELWPNRN